MGGFIKASFLPGKYNHPVGHHFGPSLFSIPGVKGHPTKLKLLSKQTEKVISNEKPEQSGNQIIQKITKLLTCKRQLNKATKRKAERWF